MGERLLIISVVILQLSILIVILQSSIFNVSSFDYLKLVEQWAPSTCNEQKKNPCRRPYPNNFTIHGLWPEFDNAEAPSFCSKTPFDLSKIKALETQLNIHWPNLIKPNKNRNFWKGQWRKHGTSSESTFDQHDYFALTLKLKGRLNLDKVLLDAEIIPRQRETYPKVDIIKANKKETKTTPLLHCNSPFNNRKISQLWEVAVCYDNKGEQYIDCPSPIPKPTATCKDDILFPDS